MKVNKLAQDTVLYSIFRYNGDLNAWYLLLQPKLCFDDVHLLITEEVFPALFETLKVYIYSH
jgi:hypothetical protein